MQVIWGKREEGIFLQRGVDMRLTKSTLLQNSAVSPLSRATVGEVKAKGVYLDDQGYEAIHVDDKT
jgi:hypothetical protein